MTTAAASPYDPAIFRHVRRQARLPLAVLAATLVYLAYAWFAFDVNALISRADPERALFLGLDSVAHKVHVTRDLRRGGLEVSIEGERTSTYGDTLPAWVERQGEDVAVDLGGGYAARIEGSSLTLLVPGYGEIRAEATDAGIVTRFPGPPPDWARATDRKFDARPTLTRRVQVSGSRIEVHRYFFGWENFFFAFDNPLQALSAGELVALATSPDRVDPARPNWRLILDGFLGNPDWQHSAVFVAVFETVLMAVLGTVTAALVGLPLAFVAARNFTPSGTLRFAVRRLFDLLRGVDMLIWSLIFIRAFGLGPLTGALAIAFTDTGTLGKLFSEALENIDGKQVEGVRSTGANRMQRYRFGVIPQILPVLVSQCLYYLESNTRSATVIGALGAGGIGLMLVETMRTSRDWENTLYIIILTVLVVVAMDWVSGWLRRRLIQG